MQRRVIWYLQSFLYHCTMHHMHHTPRTTHHSYTTHHDPPTQLHPATLHRTHRCLGLMSWAPLPQLVSLAPENRSV